MIPEFKTLKKKCRKMKIKIPEEPYFKEADEFVDLQKTFIVEDLISKASLWIDMLLYPLYVLYRLCMQDFSPMYVLSLVKTYRLWIDWFRFRVLGDKVKEWTRIVKSVGGPWISSNDPEYHVFVYADGMERLSHSLKLKRVSK
jgi:hypothetical protein